MNKLDELKNKVENFEKKMNYVRENLSIVSRIVNDEIKIQKIKEGN